MQTQIPRKSNRLDNYNYSWDGYYYITICTQNKQHFFGEIKNGKMILNQCGEIAKKYWTEIPKHFPYCQLDEFVIMPNHIHGILIIDSSIQACLNTTDEILENRPYQTLFKIVGSFKSAVSRNVRQNGFNFLWQKSFYDHIVRNEKALNNIRQYIIDNPENWNKDEENNSHNENM